jgi:Flp pilus assembly protein TadG
MLQTKDITTRVSLLKQSRIAFLRQFGRDEDGSLIIITLLLLVVMLVLGGMAVDFMRFESRRAMLQSVADRAVLAAAELDQRLEPDEVVIDFFGTQGYGGAIIGTPNVDPSNSSRAVSVEAEIDIDTFYLRLIGIDTLTAPARSAAVEGTGNVEVTLVLDISGSMRHTVVSENATKMELLRDAAKNFVDDLLLPDYEDRISINLVAYSQHVGVGDDIFKRLNTRPDTVFENGHDPISSFVTRDEFASDPMLDFGDVKTMDPALGNYYTNPARCVDFLPDEYNTLTLDTARVYKQVEYFEHYSSWDDNIEFPLCPEENFEQIIFLSQDATELKDAIDRYRPTTYTSIHLGLKWGASLLDPSMRDLLGTVGTVDDAFRGIRPADYTDANTVKYLILMTDGENVRGRRIEEDHYWNNDDSGDSYTAYEWQTAWSQYGMNYWLYNKNPDGYDSNSLTDFPTTAALHDTWMQQLCDLATAEYTVFTIAMGSTDHGKQEMEECVEGDPDSIAYTTDLSGDDDESGIDDIFDAIARQITALRLNL